MDLYSVKSKSIPQKIIIITIEVFLLLLAYWILFSGGGDLIFDKIGISPLTGNHESRVITLAFSFIVFARMSFMMLYLMERKIPWEESLSVPLAFSLYYIGFSFLVYNREIPIDWIDYFAILLFIVGSGFNTISEVQRHLWKKHPENKGKLYTIGLFKYSMHINFFGDVLWVSAYAIITRNYYSVAIPVLLFSMFAFWNIPALDKYLSGKYKEQFESYRKKTKKLIPFIY